MGKKTEFYVRCIKQAWNGSFDLANAWGPLLGAAILGGALWLVDKKLGMPDTIPGTIVFTLMCLGLAWLIIFLGRVVYFAGSLFVAKEEELRQASERLTPKLKCTFGDDVPGCVRTNTKVKFQMIGPDAQGNLVVQQVNLRGTYYRLAVETSGIGIVSNCTAYLTSIKRNSKAWVDGENLPLTFAPAEEADSTQKNLRAGITTYLDFLFISDENQPILTTKNFQGPTSLNWGDMFATAADYLFHIVISSPDSVAVAHEIKLAWTGNRGTSRLLNIGTGSK